jgi:leukotriene-A4 hydrolase
MLTTDQHIYVPLIHPIFPQDISDRVRIWAEPEVVAAAHWEFSQTEDFLQAAEEIMSPYMWTRYDVLCLPPSFPYGGMENPCLTFATPTLLAGDRSLADVIAHEIAHSWTGNLITNATWDHFVSALRPFSFASRTLFYRLAIALQ